MSNLHRTEKIINKELAAADALAKSGQKEKALKKFFSAYKRAAHPSLLRNAKGQEIMAVAAERIAAFYAENGQAEEAVKFLLGAIEDNKPNAEAEGRLLSSLGTIQNAAKDYSSALKSLLSAEEKLKNSNDYPLIVRTKFELAKAKTYAEEGFPVSDFADIFDYIADLDQKGYSNPELVIKTGVICATAIVFSNTYTTMRICDRAFGFRDKIDLNTADEQLLDNITELAARRCLMAMSLNNHELMDRYTLEWQEYSKHIPSSTEDRDFDRFMIYHCRLIYLYRTLPAEEFVNSVSREELAEKIRFFTGKRKREQDVENVLRYSVSLLLMELGELSKAEEICSEIFSETPEEGKTGISLPARVLLCSLLIEIYEKMGEEEKKAAAESNMESLKNSIAQAEGGYEGFTNSAFNYVRKADSLFGLMEAAMAMCDTALSVTEGVKTEKTPVLAKWKIAQLFYLERHGKLETEFQKNIDIILKQSPDVSTVSETYSFLVKSRLLREDGEGVSSALESYIADVKTATGKPVSVKDAEEYVTARCVIPDKYKIAFYQKIIEQAAEEERSLSEMADIYNKLGMCCYNEGEPVETEIKQFLAAEEILSCNPEYNSTNAAAVVHCNIGECMIRMDDKDGSIAQYELALRIFRQLKQNSEYYDEAQYAVAIKTLASNKAAIKVDEGDYASSFKIANDALSELLSLKSDADNVRVWLAELYNLRATQNYYLKNYSAAVEDVTAAMGIVADMENSEYHMSRYYMNRGEIFENMGKFQAAIDDYSVSVSYAEKLDENHPSIAYRTLDMGRLLEKLDDPVPSAAAYKRSASVFDIMIGKGECENSVKDDASYAYYALANVLCHRDIKNYSDALPYVSKCISILESIDDSYENKTPHLATAFKFRGEFYESFGENELAAADFKRAMCVNKVQSTDDSV
ncbi:MAG: hypothetical protein LBL82_03500 [Oscillospiraceae bacterium]|jgi:tetratricopeptide (TPR) repeat protein|nr:hypothetical protein [Oscillospiraceae bacterium]